MPAERLLTALGRKVLGIIRSNGDWMSRNDLARALNRGVLTTHTLKVLQTLMAMNLIEARSYPTKNGTQRYEYRAKAPVDDGA